MNNTFRNALNLDIIQKNKKNKDSKFNRLNCNKTSASLYGRCYFLLLTFARDNKISLDELVNNYISKLLLSNVDLKALDIRNLYIEGNNKLNVLVESKRELLENNLLTIEQKKQIREDLVLLENTKENNIKKRFNLHIADINKQLIDMIGISISNVLKIVFYTIIQELINGKIDFDNIRTNYYINLLQEHNKIKMIG